MPRWTVLTMAGLLLAGVCLSPSSTSAQIGFEEVSSLDFRGNRTFSDEALRISINTRETECRSVLFQIIPFCLLGSDFSLSPYYLNERELRRDHARVRLFYYLRGFREAVVDTLVSRPAEDEVRITFTIDEGDPVLVTDVSFLGIEELPDSSIIEGLPIEVGRPLSVVALDATRDSLESRLRNQGFARAEVFRNYDLFNDTPYESQVFFNIYPGPLTRFGPISVDITSVSGAEPSVDESVVHRMLPFREGDVYGENLRFAGQRNLYNLDIFRFVNFVPDSATAVDSILPIAIQVQEDEVHKVRAGGGVSQAECFNFEARWASLNFLGGARRLTLTGRVANVLTPFLESTPLCNQAGTDEFGDYTGRLSAEFTQPWFFSARNAINASVFAERQSVPPTFVREAVGMNVGLTRTVGYSTLLGFSFRPHWSGLRAAEVFFCSAYLVCAPEDIRLLQETNRLAPLGFSFTQDRRNRSLNPTRGYSAAFDMEYADGWTGSTFRYTRAVGEATWHTEALPRLVFGARIRGGWVRPEGFEGLASGSASNEIVHPEKRLFAGGSNSVRGFAQNRLGPRVLYLRDVTELTWGPEAGDPGLCTPQEVSTGECDAGGLEDGKFLSQPKGGTRLLEGSFEVRFPMGGPLWEGATFLDFGQVWDEEANPSLGDLKFTPGFGVRYMSPIGPIRVDLAYRFDVGESLPVVTQAVVPFDPSVHSQRERLLTRGGQETGFAVPGDLVLLQNPVLFESGLDTWSLRRFQLHFSIGQAF
jgi:outer membrane protein insertion porin family/translocation and assembly module TamA